MDDKNKLDRREFLKRSSSSLLFLTLPSISIIGSKTKEGKSPISQANTHSAEPWYHASDWESLNPGYWQVHQQSLRRKLKNVGDRARNTGFPFHYETHRLRSGPDSPVGIMDIDYDPSLPLGIMWNRKWKLEESYMISLRGTIKALTHDPFPDDNPEWRMYQKGNGVIGIAIGGKTQFDSFHPHENAPWMAVLDDASNFGIKRHTQWDLEEVSDQTGSATISLTKGDTFTIQVEVRPENEG